MKNYKVKTEDIKNTLILIQMESGEVFSLDCVDSRGTSSIIADSIYAGTNIKNVGVKVELKNGDWIKTDGKSIASRNITDSHFIEYLSKTVEVMRSFYIEGLNDNIIDIVINRLIKLDRDVTRLAEEYGY